MVDIHNYTLLYRQTEDHVRASDISERNKTLIFGYRDTCLLLNTCGKTRLIRVMGVLLTFARIMGQDFDTMGRQDVERLIAALLRREPAYSAQTLGTYKAILKRFLTWALTPDAFPKGPPAPAVAWLVSHVAHKDKHHLHRNELLTPGEIERTLAATHNPRDRALIAAAWETGARIGEIGNLELTHVSKAPHGFYLDVNGKTGRRTVLVVSSAQYLATWLSIHPHSNDPQSPLWVHYQYKTTKDIIQKIGMSTASFDTSATALVALKAAGVHDAVITAMLQAKPTPASPAATSSSPAVQRTPDAPLPGPHFAVAHVRPVWMGTCNVDF